ncbi:uncharacterized protein MONBRDRAFT_32711 [Monosiga brevicollis MX1]|uniref:Oxysterol-binding protein n=1 Tax=Monosiga brevicollis TaxID=81824 RepID=A9V188_MONBE|nr:uncharacterized protein MONBRDRAFT_32711 [Monosiga brevicollis MX1]EDQ88766.1 predicted protein [Monosiga brevicollis MX1]|eukprot:XP_001746379.1 hypothetical protein [Monosiga brevicollis MX1]
MAAAGAESTAATAAADGSEVTATGASAYGRDATTLQESFETVRDVAERTILENPRPTNGSGVWGALRAAIGKDLSRIAMPVHFNEPTSFTQRLVEDLEYSSVLDRAAAESDSLRRLAIVSAFANAMYASSAPGIRTYKAFNPLLGETYELIRPDDGYRVVTEQVSHHPPVTALHAESERGWVYRQHYACDLKFRGTLRLDPYGIAVVEFPNGDRFSWVKPTTVVHNILLGRLWVEQVRNLLACAMALLQRRDCSSNIQALFVILFCFPAGYVKDADGVIRYTLHGRWDEGLVLLPGEVPLKKLPAGLKVLQDTHADHVWSANPLPASHKPFYGMTTFAMGLNQKLVCNDHMSTSEAAHGDNVCPTDSRLRPDQRLLEDGDFMRSTAEKERLEVKQRAARAAREEQQAEWQPRWFSKVMDPQLGRELWSYQGGYWDAKADGSFKDASRFPDIF